jgi:hypothetical protein
METLLFVLPLFCIVGGTLVFRRFMRSIEDFCGLHSLGLQKPQHHKPY